MFQDTDEMGRQAQFDMWTKAKQNGLPIDDDDFYTQFDIPKPKNYDAIKLEAQEKAKAAADGGAAQQDGAKPEPQDLPATVKPKPSKPKAKQQPESIFEGLTNFFQSLFNSAGKIDTFSRKTQNEARRIARMIYDGTLPDGFIVDEDLVKLIASYLVEALEDGFGKVADYEFGSSRRILGEKLIRNAYHFSAAKAEDVQKQMQSAMVGADGEPLTFSKFRKEVDALNAQYFKNWMQTEWNTSTSAGMMAEKWAGYVEDADVMPYLQYVTVGDERVRDDHRVLDGLIRPVDDPFWNTYYPPNDWNCRCDVIQVTNPDAKPTDLTTVQVPDIPEAFNNNPGKTGEIFSQDNETLKAASGAAINQGDLFADQFLKEME